MQNPCSKHVRDKIVGQTFTEANVAYIHELLRIEHYVVHGPRSFAESIDARRLRQTYPLEYVAVIRELCPDKYEQARREEVRRVRRLAMERRRDARVARERAAHDRALWLELGGTP